MTFRQSPFNPVDALIFCQLSYLPFDNIVPSPGEDAEIYISEAAQIFANKLEKKALGKHILFNCDPEFLKILGQSTRYKDCILHSYINIIDEAQEKQFSAMCVYTGLMTFIAFKGTDDSLVGWKEDFNMTFREAIPSQLEAVQYLEKESSFVKCPLVIGGHSKGGNLAVYAAASCSAKTEEKIQAVYTFDAPGFSGNLIASNGFKKVSDRIISYIPQSSVIGLLFEHGTDFTIIKSSKTGLMQHDLYSWELTHNDMVKLDSLTQRSRFMDKTLKEWMGSMDNKHRQEVAETLYTILHSAEVKSVFDLGDDWVASTGKMIRTLGNIDYSTKKIIKRTISSLFESASNNFDLLEPKIIPKIKKLRKTIKAGGKK